MTVAALHADITLMLKTMKPMNNKQLLVEILSYCTLKELLMIQDKVNKMISIKETQKKIFDLLMKQ